MSEKEQQATHIFHRRPEDRKLWLMAEVEPNEYEWRGDQLVMKDWAQADFDKRISRPPDEESTELLQAAKDRRRAMAQEARAVRNTPLSQAEIESIDRAVRVGIQLCDAEDAGLVIP